MYGELVSQLYIPREQIAQKHIWQHLIHRFQAVLKQFKVAAGL